MITDWLLFIDRDWIEQRLYQIEELDLEESLISPTEAAKEAFSEFTAKSKHNAIVILGEPFCCDWMIQAAPFLWKARMPKAPQIFRIHYSNKLEKGWKREYLGTYTASNLSISRETQEIKPPESAVDIPRVDSRELEGRKRRRVSALDFWPSSGAQDTDSMAPSSALSNSEDEY